MRAARLTAVVAGIAALAGCGLAPERVDPWDPDSVSKPAMTRSELQPALTSYDTRNNAAIAATSRTRDPRAWATADGEVLLDEDQFGTRWRTVTRAKPDRTTITHRGVDVYAPEFAAYPMYAVATADVTSNEDTEKDEAARSDSVDVVVMTREEATEDWIHVASVFVPKKGLPTSREPGPASTPTPEQEEVAVAAAEALRKYVDTGKPSGIGPDEGLKRNLDALGRDLGAAEKQSLSASFHQQVDDQAGAAGSVRPVVTDGGVLAVASYDVMRTLHAERGSTLEWKEPYDAVRGETRDLPRLSHRFALTAVLLVDEAGRATVLGSRMVEVL